MNVGETKETFVGLSLNSESEAATEAKVPVEARSLDLIAIMAATNTKGPSKSIEWENFVHVMANTRFAARIGGESAVSFEKDGYWQDNSHGKVAFHKLQPFSKIDPVIMRSMGKRTTKWFGWHRHMFVLAT